MSRFVFSLRVRDLKNKFRRYEHEKHNSIRIHEGFLPEYTIFDYYHHFWFRFWRRFSRLFALCTLPQHSRLRRFCKNLCSENTFENYILKSVGGFIGGVVLTYIIFLFLVVQFGYSVTTATALCSVLAAVLTLGLAFSLQVRCFVFLLLPVFFSSRGRQALLAYTLMLAIAGPGRNTINNVNILCESMTCTVEELKHALMQTLDAIKRPFIMIKDAIHKVMAFIKKIAEKMKEAFLAIKRVVISIGALIKNVYHWLKSVVNICNTDVGTPFQRCTRVFGDAVADCQAKLGPMFNWLCSVAYLADVLCVTVYFLDLLCLLLDFLKTNIGVIGTKLKEFSDQIKTLFYVRIDVNREYEMETVQSKTYQQIAAEIVAEIQERVTVFMIMFGFIGILLSSMFFNILIRIWCYKRKFLTAEYFDNIYITQEFVELDVRRAAMDMETVLPLSRTEHSQYIMLWSLRLVRTEKLKLVKHFVIIGVASFKILTYLVIDYSLFWLMTVIRKHGRFKSTVKAPNMVGVHIEGEGMLANLLRSIVNALRPFGIKLEIDTIHCLRNPLQPDLFTYAEIVFLLALCCLLAILEPYGLRLRAYIMGRYYPDRAKQRAVWLYNHILKSRTSLLKYIRRQLRHKFFKDGGGIERITLLEQLETWCPFLRKLLGLKKDSVCLLCGHVIREGAGEKILRCYKPDCPGTFCEQCFAELDNLCTLCMEPVEYGDLSDVSLEEDSDYDDDVDDMKPFSQWRRENAEEETELLSLENVAADSHTHLSYEYQDDVGHDPNINKPPLIPVVSRTSLPRPTLSSTQLFSQPLPTDYTSRRNDMLEQLEEERQVFNKPQAEDMNTDENNPASTNRTCCVKDFLCSPFNWWRKKRKNQMETEPLLESIHMSVNERLEEMPCSKSNAYCVAASDGAPSPVSSDNRLSFTSLQSQSYYCSSSEQAAVVHYSGISGDIYHKTE